MNKEIVIPRSQEEIEDNLVDVIDEYIQEVYDGEIGEDGEEFDLAYTNGGQSYIVTITIEKYDYN